MLRGGPPSVTLKIENGDVSSVSSTASRPPITASNEQLFKRVPNNKRSEKEAPVRIALLCLTN